jgi:large subunit ribosomal protein L30
MSKTLIKIEQTGSPIRPHHKQRSTLIGLGLSRIGRISQILDAAATRGTIDQSLRWLVSGQFVADLALYFLLERREDSH